MSTPVTDTNVLQPPPAICLLLLGIALGGLICWLIRRPRRPSDVRHGHPTWVYSIEWPVAYLTVIALITLHLLASSNSTYCEMLGKNREPLASTGTFLFLTVGGFALKNVRSDRRLRIACLVLAALGTVLLTLKWNA